eukprot:CAMPEP_0194509000 /NCGR_PEP_ID=MMETSP0253-20130528/39371_1 /TAXON_ID=2966 /ORGANISM="Noctiluca scintillans" /LENGTH=124 /DNA_ID=CAMNT_0039352083 /DNA_START=98 /DNA_END=472 /DNA_ORIENTATION=+
MMGMHGQIRGVTPLVEDRDSLKMWKTRYESRLMKTSLMAAHRHEAEVYSQAHRTLQDKERFFRKHDVPDRSWGDLSRESVAKQPTFFGSGSVGVMLKRSATPLNGKTLCPALNINSKAGQFFGT